MSLVQKVSRCFSKISAINPFQASFPINSLLLIRRLNSSNQLKYDNEIISQMIKNDKIVIFIKGVPDAPRCGFSNAVVQVLRMHGAPFQAHNVLESDDLRKAIKDFTGWPTIPQIFLDGEFIGGCDILLEKHQNGELIEDLKKIGIKSQILKEQEENDKK